MLHGESVLVLEGHSRRGEEVAGLTVKWSKGFRMAVNDRKNWPSGQVSMHLLYDK